MSELNNIKNEFEDIAKEVDKELNDEPILNDVINTILTMTQDEEKESSVGTGWRDDDGRITGYER